MKRRPAAWQVWDFEDLPTLSRDRVGLSNLLARLRDGAGGLPSAAQRVLEGFSPSTEEAEGTVQEAPLALSGPAPADAPDPFGEGIRVRCRIVTAASVEGPILDLEFSAVRNLIACVTGIPRARLDASDLLTDVEAGVLGFFLERTLAGTTEAGAVVAPLLPWSLGGVECVGGEDGSEADRAGRAIWSGAGMVAGVTVPFRVLVPRPCLELLAAQMEENASLEGDARLKGWVDRMASNPVRMVGRIGRVVLPAEDVRRIEAGDVLLFEPDGPSWEETGGLSGRLVLGVPGGAGQGPSVITEIEEDDGVIRVRVTDIERNRLTRNETEVRMAVDQTSGSGDAPDPEDAGTGAAEGGDQGVAGSDAAGDLPISLRIEIGRLRMSLADFARLRAGTVLELERQYGGAVSLVVEDKTVGRGRLVKIEGQLGVTVDEIVQP
jgi:type III secretion system YscQ/HrcQ family protein